MNLKETIEKYEEKCKSLREEYDNLCQVRDWLIMLNEIRENRKANTKEFGNSVSEDNKTVCWENCYPPKGGGELVAAARRKYPRDEGEYNGVSVSTRERNAYFEGASDMLYKVENYLIKIGASQFVTEEFHKKMMGYVSENREVY
jgi:hypothetical protein